MPTFYIHTPVGSEPTEIRAAVREAIAEGDHGAASCVPIRWTRSAAKTARHLAKRRRYSTSSSGRKRRSRSG